MAVRPGRALANVMIGGLLATGLTLGMGTAGASAPITQAPCAVLSGVVVTGDCGNGDSSAAAGPTAEELAARAAEAAQLNAARERAARERAAQDRAAADQAAAQRRADRAAQQAGLRAAQQQAARNQAAQEQVAREQAARDQAARQAQLGALGAAAPTAGLLTPSSSGAEAPGGLAAGLLTGAPPSVGTYNPGLLLPPAGSPLRSLIGQDEGSPVTTASQVQSMVFDNLPGGLGTPVVLGVLILSTLSALALRHRVLRRARVDADLAAANTAIV